MVAGRVTLCVSKIWLRNCWHPNQQGTNVPRDDNVQSMALLVCGSHHVLYQSVSFQCAIEAHRIWIVNVVEVEVEVTCYDYIVSYNSKAVQVQTPLVEKHPILKTVSLRGRRTMHDAQSHIHIIGNDRTVHMFEMCKHAIPCRIQGLNGQSAFIEYGYTSTALLTGSRDVLYLGNQMARVRL